MKVKQSLAETENFHNDKEMLSSFLGRTHIPLLPFLAIHKTFCQIDTVGT